MFTVEPPERRKEKMIQRGYIMNTIEFIKASIEGNRVRQFGRIATYNKMESMKRREREKQVSSIVMEYFLKGAATE